MAGVRKHQYPPDNEIVDRAKDGLSIGQIADLYGVNQRTFDSYISTRPGLRERIRESRTKQLEVVDPKDYLTSDDPKEWGDIDALLESRGLKTEDWVVTKVSLTEWGENAEGEPLKRLRVDLTPRSFDSLMPARTEGWRPPPRLVQTPKTDAELVVFFGDHHAPHHDPDLHTAAVAWLRKNKPARGVICGDLLDYDSVSRHRKNPLWASTTQECLDSAYSILRAYVQASPGTRWQMLDGNHEERMRNAVLDHLMGVHGITRAVAPEETKGQAVLSVAHLLRLDELGIEWVGSEGEYGHSQVMLSGRLAVRHGWIARKGSGASALATLDHLRYSCVIGHCHRQAIVKHTGHSINGEPMELTGVEAGTMAQIRGGLGYSIAPNWQQGFATARIWPDGFFSCDLAKFVDGTLVWANQRVDTRSLGVAVDAALAA
jgi:hypothetical protein